MDTYQPEQNDVTRATDLLVRGEGGGTSAISVSLQNTDSVHRSSQVKKKLKHNHTFKFPLKHR